MEIEITATLECIDRYPELRSCRGAVVALLGDLFDRVDRVFNCMEQSIKHQRTSRELFLEQLENSDLSDLYWKKIPLEEDKLLGPMKKRKICFADLQEIGPVR
jgi:hypothetical protein